MAVVMGAHSSVFSTNRESFFGVRYCVGELGLNVFLVLSAYLLAKGFFQDTDGFRIGKFYVNRLMRLLPAYYAAFPVTILLNAIHDIPPKSYYVMLQNFSFYDLMYIPVTWSLCIEEWMYAALMLLFFVLSLNKKWDRGKVFLAAALFLGVLAMVLRARALIMEPMIDYDYPIRKQTLLRMDTFAVGILAAWLEARKQALYEKLMKSRVVFVLWLCCLSGSMFLWYRLLGGAQNPFAKWLIYLSLPLSALYLILKVKDLKLWEAPVLQKAKKPLAVASALTYPCYLVHFQFYIYVSDYCNNNLIMGRVGPFLLTLLAVIGTAALIHFALEVPMNDLRRKLVSKMHM